MQTAECEAITPKEAERRSSLSRTTLWRLEKAGKLVTSKVGRRKLISVDSLNRVIQKGEAIVGAKKAVPA